MAYFAWAEQNFIGFRSIVFEEKKQKHHILYKYVL